MSTFLHLDGLSDWAASDYATPITGDLDVRAKVRATDWTPPGPYFVAGQWGAAGNLGWHLYLYSTGALVLETSSNGTATHNCICDVYLHDAVTLVDNSTDIWIRVTHDRDDGGGVNHVTKFYFSLNGTDWTQVGSTLTEAGAAAIFSTTAVMRVGNDAYPTATLSWNGRIYSVEVRNGIGGTIVANPDFTASPWDVGETVNDDAQGNTWTLTGAYIAADQTVTLDPAVRTRTAADITATGGPVTVTLDAAQRTRTAGDMLVTPGPIIITLDAAQRTRTASDLTIAFGTVTITLDTAHRTRTAQNITAVAWVARTATITSDEPASLVTSKEP
ncbi:MAG: hypothetical protein V2A79_01940 [Planctomycetota bacterium]